MNLERVDSTLKRIREDYESAIKCGCEQERAEVYSTLLPRALVIAEVMCIEMKELDTATYNLKLLAHLIDCAICGYPKYPEIFCYGSLDQAVEMAQSILESADA